MRTFSTYAALSYHTCNLSLNKMNHVILMTLEISSQMIILDAFSGKKPLSFSNCIQNSQIQFITLQLQHENFLQSMHSQKWLSLLQPKQIEGNYWTPFPSIWYLKMLQHQKP